jgi:hypothetical protein
MNPTAGPAESGTRIKKMNINSKHLFQKEFTAIMARKNPLYSEALECIETALAEETLTANQAAILADYAAENTGYDLDKN